MAKRRRDNASEYARRNQLAQEAGWKSVGQYRYAREKFKNAPIDVQGKYGRFLVNKGRDLSPNEEKKAFRAFWQGLIDPATRDDISRSSPKAEWFVIWLDLEDFDHDLDVWVERYGEKA